MYEGEIKGVWAVFYICSEECKGLCPICGQNLNDGECSCDKEQTDPRFDILDNLL